MKTNLDKDNISEQREFEKQGMAGSPELPQEVLKLYKLRMIISKAWLPLGISREEGADILMWAVGKDVTTLNFNLWPERIMDNVGIIFDPKVDKVVDIMRRIAKVWQSKKVKPYYTGV